MPPNYKITASQIKVRATVQQKRRGNPLSQTYQRDGQQQNKMAMKWLKGVKERVLTFVSYGNLAGLVDYL